MAVRRKNEPGGRQIRYTIRLSEEEQKALQVKANALGVKVSRMLADAAFKNDDSVDAIVWLNELVAMNRRLAAAGFSDELQDQVQSLIRKFNG